MQRRSKIQLLKKLWNFANLIWTLSRVSDKNAGNFSFNFIFKSVILMFMHVMLLVNFQQMLDSFWNSPVYGSCEHSRCTLDSFSIFLWANCVRLCSLYEPIKSLDAWVVGTFYKTSDRFCATIKTALSVGFFVHWIQFKWIVISSKA